MLRAFSLERISGQKTDDLHNEEIKIAENWFYQIVRPKNASNATYLTSKGFHKRGTSDFYVKLHTTTSKILQSHFIWR